MIGALMLLLACADDPDQPHALAYDQVACDACGMMVSEPLFAAQLVTQTGERYEFDDPACAFGYIAEKHPSIRHLWFRDASSQTEAWLDWAQVAFVPATGAPMDGGSAIQIGQRESCDAVAAESGAQQGKQGLVLVDRQ